MASMRKRVETLLSHGLLQQASDLPTRSMWKAVGVLLSATCLEGCAHHRDLVQAAPEPPSIYLVEVVGGEVAASRPDGRPWDDLREERPGELQLVTPMGSVAVKLGFPPIDASPNPGAPDPAVTFSFQGRQIEVPPSRDSFTPGWRYRFLIDPVMDPPSTVSVQVDDDDGELQQSMGVRTLAWEELIGQERIDLGPFGSVAHLHLTVSRIDPDRVPMFETATHPVEAPLEGWHNTGLDLISGMHLAIAADGKARLSRFSTRSWGPEGVTDPQLLARWQDRNLQGFEDVRHGALIGCIVDPVSQMVTQRLTIGDGMLTRVEGSGILLLGINDTDVGNNAGTFHVRIGGGIRVPVETVALPH